MHWLRLVRLPNVITAACNSLAGALCVGIGFNRWPYLLHLAIVSMCLYAAGILLNDLFDLAEDRRDRPARPLPSGLISPRTTATVAALLCLFGLAMAWVTSPRIGQVAVVLLLSIIAYDIGLKRSAVGPLLMGLCRGLNLALGLVLAQQFPTWGLMAVTGYTLYIAGITCISRLETLTGQTRGLRLGFALILAGIGFVLAAILYPLGPNLASLQSGQVQPGIYAGILLIFILLRLLSRRWKLALAQPAPATIQQLVKTGIISLPMLDLSLSLSFAGLVAALPLVALWAIARLTARKLYTT